MEKVNRYHHGLMMTYTEKYGISSKPLGHSLHGTQVEKRLKIVETRSLLMCTFESWLLKILGVYRRFRLGKWDYIHPVLPQASSSFEFLAGSTCEHQTPGTAEKWARVLSVRWGTAPEACGIDNSISREKNVGVRPRIIWKIEFRRAD